MAADPGTVTANIQKQVIIIVVSHFKAISKNDGFGFMTVTPLDEPRNRHQHGSTEFPRQSFAERCLWATDAYGPKKAGLRSAR